VLKHANPRYYTLRFTVACESPKNGFCHFSLHSACRFVPTNSSNGNAHRRAKPASHYILSKSENAEKAGHLLQIQLIFSGLSFLFNLLAAKSHVLSAYSMSALLFIATLARLSVAILLFLYESSQSTEALLLHIADIRQSGR